MLSVRLTKLSMVNQPFVLVLLSDADYTSYQPINGKSALYSSSFCPLYFHFLSDAICTYHQPINGKPTLFPTLLSDTSHISHQHEKSANPVLLILLSSISYTSQQPIKSKPILHAYHAVWYWLHVSLTYYYYYYWCSICLYPSVIIFHYECLGY